MRVIATGALAQLAMETKGLACALALSGALLASALAQPAWDTSGGDDGMYVMLAWALQHGLGYVHEIGTQQITHTVWPPGFPAMLSAVLFLWPQGTVVPPEALRALKLVPVLTYAYAILLAWLWVRSIGGSAPAALGVAVLFLLHPGALVFSQLLRAEMPYTALSLGALIAAEHWLLPARHGGTAPRSTEIWRHGLILLLTLSAAYIRPIGVALLGAWLVRLLLARRFTLMLAYAAVGGLALAPWGWWLLQHRMSDTEAMQYLSRSHFGWLLQRETAGFDISLRSVWELPQWALDGLWLYAGRGTPHLIVQSRLPLEPVAGLAVTALLVAGGVACWRHGAKASCLYVLFYLGIVLVWEERTNRLFVPLLPLLLYCLYRGLETVVTRLQERVRWQPSWPGMCRSRSAAGDVARGASTLAAAMLLALGANYIRVGAPQLTQVYQCSGEAGCLYPPQWQAFVAAGEWLQLHATAEDIVLATEPVKLRLMSGVPAVPYVPFGTDGTDELAQAIERWRVTYIVEDAGLYAAPRAQFATKELRRNVQHLPGATVVWEDPATGTRVWRVTR